MISKECTTGLFEDLENAGMKHGFKDYLSQHPDTTTAYTFAEYINNYVSSHKDIPISYIANHCGFDPDYAREIMRGKKNGSRDKIIAICITAKMNLKETRRALKIAGCSDLYPKIARDTALIICINNELYDITKVNEYLDENRCKVL